MESFLNFITDNYTYFLIAAGVLTLALIGLLVSGKNKKKKGDNVNVEETPVDVNKTEAPTEISTPSVEPAKVEEVKAPVAPEPAPVVTPEVAPTQVSETIDLASPVTPTVTPVQPTATVPTPPAIEPTPVQPAVNATPDEPIVNINPAASNTFEINQNNNTTPGNGQ